MCVQLRNWGTELWVPAYPPSPHSAYWIWWLYNMRAVLLRHLLLLCHVHIILPVSFNHPLCTVTYTVCIYINTLIRKHCKQCLNAHVNYLTVRALACTWCYRKATKKWQSFHQVYTQRQIFMHHYTYRGGLPKLLHIHKHLNSLAHI